MATHASILAWKIAWTKEPDGLQSMGVAESDTNERLTTHVVVGPGLGNASGYRWKSGGTGGHRTGPRFSPQKQLKNLPAILTETE